MAFRGEILISDGNHEGTHWEYIGIARCANCGASQGQTIQAKKEFWPRGVSERELEIAFEERVKEHHVCFGLKRPTTQDLVDLTKPAKVKGASQTIKAPDLGGSLA